MDVSVIIVNYNSHQLTCECIRSIQAHTQDILYEIIVVDNASRDNNIIELQRAFPSVLVIGLRENIGFGRANNVGMQVAKGQYIFLLNPDTLLSDNSILTFFRYMNDPANAQVAVCGATLVNKMGVPAMSYGNFPSFLGNFLSIGFHLFVRKYYAENLDTGVAATTDRTRAVAYVSGAAFFARKKIIEQVGYFDDDFFLYFEETELCWRIGKSGYKVVYLPAVTIMHYEGGTTATFQQQSINPFAFYHYYRSKRLFYRKTMNSFSSYIFYIFDILHELNKSFFRGKMAELSQKLRLMTKPV